MELCNYNYNIICLALAHNKKYIDIDNRVSVFVITVDWNEWPYKKIEIILPKKNITYLSKELKDNPPLKNESFWIFDTYYLSPIENFLKILFWGWYL